MATFRSLLHSRRVWMWTALGAALLAIAALVDVTVVGPRIYVRWTEGIADSDRALRERRYDLRIGEPDRESPATWQYELGNRSSDNLAAILADPLVEDTHNINRDTLTAPASSIQVRVRSLPPALTGFLAFSAEDLPAPSNLLRLHPSLWLLLAGVVLFRASRVADVRRRRLLAAAALLFAGAVMVAKPLDPTFVKMGEVGDRATREDFERYFSGRVRFEKHLSQVILLQLYVQSGPTEAAPGRAMVSLGRLASVWFVLCACAIGLAERWSPTVLRYLALCVMAPATLLFFGWQEFSYLALSAAAFPLLVQGLRTGDRRLEAGSAFTGIGAALHGIGLLSLAGALAATLLASGRLHERVGRVLRLTAWSTAAYLGWVAIYVIVLNLPIEPQSQQAGGQVSLWRPLFVDAVRVGRVSPAIFSVTGLRDLSVSAWIVGVPLIAVIARFGRRYVHETRSALCYLLPSIIFLTFRWPFTGIGQGMDLVVAGFPAFYALAWICAQEVRPAAVAAAILASAHVAFWWAVLDLRFAVGRFG